MLGDYLAYKDVNTQGKIFNADDYYRKVFLQRKCGRWGQATPLPFSILYIL